MENLVSSSFWKEKRVLVTGHSGFKGGWLSLWLHSLGARVAGISLPPETSPSLFAVTNLAGTIESHFCDIRHLENMTSIVHRFQPEVIFHLAAQPLVVKGYQDPIGTYETNFMGTANVLQSCRGLSSLRSVVCITTDKVYANNENNRMFEEDDRLGGNDPYSSSKAACEILIDSFRNSFFSPLKYADHHVAIASARAGNVIGGGDWSAHRLVPDILRAQATNEELIIRNPHAVRPWQHVIEPVAGYLRIAELLFENGPQYGQAFNFGPDAEDCVSVQEVVTLAKKLTQGSVKFRIETSAVHEAQLLRLDNRKAKQMLGWKPKWHVEQALAETLRWHQSRFDSRSLVDVTLSQISDWVSYR